MLLTYFFVRRYYGRIAATIAALLYATSVSVFLFSRDIWQPNVIPFFTLLFFFALFRGVVERRQGWLFPALLLLGVLYQLHGSSLLLALSLGVAFVFAFKTVRIRDIVFAAIALLIIFSPFLLLEWHTQFTEVRALFTAAQKPAPLDTEALRFYKFFLQSDIHNPYLNAAARNIDSHIIFPDGSSVMVTTPLHYFRRLLSIENALLPLLLICGIITTALCILLPPKKIAAGRDATRKSGARTILYLWWRDFMNTPARQGFVLLLTWQVVPLVLLLRHSVELYSHYFIFFIPGQFILVALFIGKLMDIVQTYRPAWDKVARYSLSVLAGFAILMQLIGSTGYLLDMTQGHFNAYQFYPYFFDLGSMEQAFAEADHLAQQRHIHRVYIASSYVAGRAMNYLTESMKTPTTIVDTWHCLILPDPKAGPVVFLAQPDSGLTDTMLKEYASTQLVNEPPRLGGSPFKLYILAAKPEPAPVATTFDHGLQLLSPNAHPLLSVNNDQKWLVTRWRITDAMPPAPRVNHGFSFQIQADDAKMQSDNIFCSPHATWPGDQILLGKEFSLNAALPANMHFQVSSFTDEPASFIAGPLTMTTFDQVASSQNSLQTTNGQKDVLLPVTP